jgi:hypothetical protein
MPRMTEAEALAQIERARTWGRKPKRVIPDEKPDPGPESNLQAKCEEYLRSRGWEFFHDRSRSKNRPGIPDLIVWAPGGRTLQIELKAKGGRMSEEQKLFRLNLSRNGHIVHEVKSFRRFIEIIENSAPNRDVAARKDGGGSLV